MTMAASESRHHRASPRRRRQPRPTSRRRTSPPRCRAWRRSDIGRRCSAVSRLRRSAPAPFHWRSRCVPYAPCLSSRGNSTIRCRSNGRTVTPSAASSRSIRRRRIGRRPKVDAWLTGEDFERQGSERRLCLIAGKDDLSRPSATFRRRGASARELGRPAAGTSRSPRLSNPGGSAAGKFCASAA